MILTRVCKICNTEKPIDDFNLRKQKGRKVSHRSECKVCISKYKKSYYTKNKSDIIKKQKEYTEKNKKKILENKAKYRSRNRQKCRDLVKKHYNENREDYIKRATEWNKNNKKRRSNICKRSSKRNPHTSAANLAKRRFSKKQATPRWSETDKIKIVYKKARELSLLLGVDMQVDHVIPLQSDNVCGLHVWANLQILEKRIHVEKSNKVLI